MFRRLDFYILLTTLVALSSNASDFPHRTLILQIIQASEPPQGIVFEIVEAKRAFLDWALPEIETLSEKLTIKYPDLDIVVVTHGYEMLALTKSNQDKNPRLKQKVTSLTHKDIAIHVCGTFAGWNDVEESEFPSTIKIAAAAPALINDYVELGYTVIRVAK